MKPIQKNELYEHVSGFLKAKGVSLTEGSYAGGIQKGCSLLTDAINLSQKGIKRAKSEIDDKLDRMRQVIHEKTAPTGASQPRPAKATAAKKKTRAAKPRIKPTK